MFILHLNPIKQVASVFRQFQTRPGSVEVEVFGEYLPPHGKGASLAEVRGFLKGLKRLPEIVHIHDINLICEKEFEDFLEELKKPGKTRLVLSLGDKESNGSAGTETFQISSELIDAHFDLVLVHDANLLPLAERSNTVSWFPYPVDPAFSNEERVCEIPEREILVQAVYSRDTSEYKQCEKIIEELKSAGHRISLIPATFNDRGLSQKSDILIERLSGEGYGYTALLGLASGATVLAVNPNRLRAVSKQLEMSSVLDTNWQNVKSRLESLLTERRSLRDLSNRSKEYINNFHRGDLIAAELVEMYRQLL